MDGATGGSPEEGSLKGAPGWVTWNESLVGDPYKGPV
jgi:hypothetical protein